MDNSVFLGNVSKCMGTSSCFQVMFSKVCDFLFASLGNKFLLFLQEQILFMTSFFKKRRRGGKNKIPEYRTNSMYWDR